MTAGSSGFALCTSRSDDAPRNGGQQIRPLARWQKKQPDPPIPIIRRCIEVTDEGFLRRVKLRLVHVSETSEGVSVSVFIKFDVSIILETFSITRPRLAYI